MLKVNLPIMLVLGEDSVFIHCILYLLSFLLNRTVSCTISKFELFSPLCFPLKISSNILISKSNII